MDQMNDLVLHKIRWLLPVPFRSFASYFAMVSNFFLFYFWFEPVLLRLNLLRGLLWVCLRIAPLAITVSMFRYQLTGREEFAFAYLASSLAVIPILQNRRSNPWMSALAGVLVASVAYFLYHHQPGWLYAIETSMPYAAVMLFGTRLTSPSGRRSHPAAA